MSLKRARRLRKAATRESEPHASSSRSTDDSSADPPNRLTYEEKTLIAHFFVVRNLERYPVYDTLEKIGWHLESFTSTSQTLLDEGQAPG